MGNPDSSTPSDQLHRLVVAGWGVCCGALVATAITAVFIAFRTDTTESLHPSLLPSEYLVRFGGVYWQERYERMWYALTCVLGALGGWIALRYLRPHLGLALVAVIAFVPTAAWVCRGVFKGQTNLERFLAAAAILALPLLRRVPIQAPSDLPATPRTEKTPIPAKRLWISAGLVCLPLTLLLYGTIGPHHVATVASECNKELHVASYIVGPALYYRARAWFPASTSSRTTASATPTPFRSSWATAGWRRPSNASSCSSWSPAFSSTSPRSWS